VSSTAPLETLTLIEEELVAGRGSSEVTWRVAKNDGWQRPGGVAGARVERLERGAGVIWRTRIELELPRGTRLMRVETRPNPGKRSTLAHLTQPSLGARKQTRRSEYRVGAGGVLERVERG
jgi:hypothetical protein